ncbi:MAG: hypothetical protein HOH29_07390, partial [Cellvibrionales bacterium]|nr:hypothetical protein [Cellvibrionales bacterium]
MTNQVDLSASNTTSNASEHFGNTSVFLGWRFFAGRERNALVSFISSVSIAGLSLAIALLIVVLSVMNGFEKEFRDRILGLAPHATLWFAAPINDWQVIVNQLDAEADVIRAQPIIEFKAMAVAANRVQPVLIQGVDYRKVSDLMKAYLGSNQQAEDSKPPAEDSINQAINLPEKNLVLGKGVADQLGLLPGDKLRLMVPDSTANNVSNFNAASSAVSHSFILSDTLITGTEIDNGIGLINLSDAARITQLGGQIQGIQLQVVDIFEARRIATHLAINHQL